MGFFDPPHKKIIEKSPAYFQQSAPIWGSILEALMASDPLLTKAGNLFRATVIGRLALYTAEKDPANWSSDAVRYIRMTTNNAERLLPESFRQTACNFVAELIKGPDQDEDSKGPRLWNRTRDELFQLYQRYLEEFGAEGPNAHWKLKGPKAQPKLVAVIQSQAMGLTMFAAHRANPSPVGTPVEPPEDYFIEPPGDDEEALDRFRLETMPFAVLPSGLAGRALVEYMVWRFGIEDNADIDFINRTVVDGLSSMSEDEQATALGNADTYQFAWWRLV